MRIYAVRSSAAFLIGMMMVVPAHALVATPTCRGKPATIKGTRGHDVLRGTRGADVIVGGSGNDQINGRGGKDSICGGRGDDLIVGGHGSDWLDGDTGSDTASWANSARGVNVNLPSGKSSGDGNDLIIETENVVGSAQLDYLAGNDEANSLQGGAGDDSIEGGPGDDLLSGGDGIDAIWGDAGNDVLSGDTGDDRMDGGLDTDSIDGGEGKDSCKDQEQDAGCEIFWADVALEDQLIDNTSTNGHVDFGRTFPSLEQVCFWVYLRDDLLEDGETFWFRLGAVNEGAFGKSGSEPPLNLIVSCLVSPGHEEVNLFLDGVQDMTLDVDGDETTLEPDGGGSVIVDKMEIEVTLASF